MHVHEIESYILSVLPKLGVNKLRELARLVYEICKREHCAPQEVLAPSKNLTFESAKKTLLMRRYPVNFKTAEKSRFYLPKLELDETLKSDLTPRPFYPKTVYIEESAKDSELAARVRAALRQYLAGKTVLIATHDAALLALADHRIDWEVSP